MRLTLIAGFLMGTFVASTSAQTTHSASDPLHIWVGNPDAASVTQWVQSHLEIAAKTEAALLAVKGPRTVENTLKPYDEVVREIHTASMGPSLLNNASPVKELRDVAQVEIRRVSAAGTELSLNRAVYDALAAVDATHADTVTRFYLERTLRDYRLDGVDKDDATRKQIRELRDTMTGLTLQFGRNIAEGSAQIEVKDAAELDGLPADYLERHKPNEHGVIIITTDEPDYRPVMTYAKSTDLRLRLFTTYMTRCYPANKEILLQILEARAKLAHLLGFDNWADYAAADKMIGNAANIRTLIAELDKAARPARDKELELLLAFAQSKDASIHSIPEYSASYWMEQYKRSTFQFDSQAVRAYFPFAEVQQGVLDTAARLLHISFVRVPDAATWDKSVDVFDVTDGREPGGKKLGRIYLDMHPRAGKNKWFNAGPVVIGKRGVSLPEARLNGNFAGGDAGDPGLMQYADVVTFFHEFGHMMHAILGGDQLYAGTTPFSIEWDFVEAPSQMLESFFESRKVLDTFARNYKTGETMPQDLFDKMMRADEFGRGIGVERQLQLSTFALELHDRDPKQVDIDALMASAYKKYSAFTEAPENRMYATFNHLTSYASNYYTYQLSKVIALDFFQQFDPNNLLDGPAAMRYRKAVLEPGGSESANTLVKNFLGRPQQYDAMRTWINAEFEHTAQKK